jgi:hypothetical protein
MSRIRRRIENRWTRKADQEWDMAGLARQDGDREAERQHTERAREYERKAHEQE